MSAGPIRFGEFELDCDRYELLRAGRRLKLEKIPMELLILLVAKDGHLVTRQEIVERLWGNEVFLDTEHGINTAIRKIRQALRDDPEQPRFVETVTGKGYRFIAEQKNGNSRAQDAGSIDVAVEEAPPPSGSGEIVSSEARPAKVGHWRLVAIAALVLCLLGAALVGFNAGGLRDRIFVHRPAFQIQSIAVLPLVNLSGDAAQDYFADGMTDELITALAKNHSLRVVSRTSAMQYKGVRRPLPQIAKELGVDGILEGSVEHTATRVHITVQLIQGPSDTHIWAESYDRDLKDVISLPSELSQTIAKEVKIAVSPESPKRYINPEAHDAYLHGRYFWFAEDYDRSQEYFEKAVQLQPDYAAAWSGLADVYVVRAVALLAPPQEVREKAYAASRKALELDDSLSEAHRTAAAFSYFLDWDWKNADAESLRAVQLDPNQAEAHHLRSYVLTTLNRPDEALQEQKRGMEIDPFVRPWALGFTYLHLRQYDAAINELRLRLEAQPQDGISRSFLSDVYWYKGMWKESVEELDEGLRMTGDKETAAAIRHAFESGGYRAVAELRLERMKAAARKQYVSPLRLAYRYARVGRKEETLKFLEDAYREHSAWLVFVQNEPSLDFVHGDERYQAIVKKMGLPPAY